MAEKNGFFSKLKSGLGNVFSGFSDIDDDFYEELEETLVCGDVGVKAASILIENLKQEVKKNHLKSAEECRKILINILTENMATDESMYVFEKTPSIIMFIGVNGVGKTTSVGKLAAILKNKGLKVMIAAADTFRAAAREQLTEWAKRADVPIVGGNEGADPSSVIFDAVSAAKARGVDVLLIDTAGRLHNKKNLMEELKKMDKIIERVYPEAHRENLLVLDGTTGQNALMQAKEFGEVAPCNGIVLTKMDGTAKGGIAIAVKMELGYPVKYIGFGEKTEDLKRFDPEFYVNSIFE